MYYRGMRYVFESFIMIANVTTPCSQERVFIIGLKPTERGMKNINRWRDKGYDDRTIWQGMEVVASRYIERNYAVGCRFDHQSIPELYESMEQMFPDMMSPNLYSIFQGINLNTSLLKLSLLPWKLVIEIEEFTY